MATATPTPTTPTPKAPEVESVDSGRLVFTFQETEPDGGGSLTIQATGDNWKEELCDMYRRDFPSRDKYAPLQSPDPLTIQLDAHDTRNYGREAWYAFPLALDSEWFDPYWKILQRLTGYTGPMPLDLTFTDTKPLCHTGHRAAFRFEDGHLQATYYHTGHAYNGRTALDYSHGLAERYFKETVGHTPSTPEFLHASGGLYKHNPDYGRGPKAPTPKATNPIIWSALWNWWRANHASVKQELILQGVEALKQKSVPLEWECIYDRCPYGYSLHCLDPQGTCDFDGKGKKTSVYTWEEFAKLTKAL